MITPRLLTAYRRTCYVADGVVVRIGRRGSGMDRLLVSFGAHEAAFITAFNPHSRRKPAGWNRRMQGQLMEVVRRRRWLPATGSWRRWEEAHLLVFGAVRPMRRLMGVFRQNGIVIVRRGQPVRLLVVRKGWTGRDEFSGRRIAVQAAALGQPIRKKVRR